MSKGGYLGGGTVITGRDVSWFAREKEKDKTLAKAKNAKRKAVILERRRIEKATQKLEYDAYLKASEKGSVLIRKVDGSGQKPSPFSKNKSNEIKRDSAGVSRLKTNSKSSKA